MPATEHHTERSKGICIEHKSAARSVPRASASMIPSVPLPQFLTHFATLPPLLHPSKLPRIYSPRTMRFAKARSLFRPADSWPRCATRDPCPSESNGKRNEPIIEIGEPSYRPSLKRCSCRRPRYNRFSWTWNFDGEREEEGEG